MNQLWLRWKYLLACVGMIFLTFIIFSLLDVFVAIKGMRFYSNAAFITVFGVGGIFAGMLSYINCIDMAPQKNEFARWTLISTIIGMGALFFFLLSEIEGGEYRVPFKAFGITMAACTLLFMKGKID
jgi:hypothetical protein